MTEKISSYQLAALFFATILSTLAIAYPPSVAGKSGWISGLLAIGLKLLVIIIAILAIKRNGKKTLVESLNKNPIIKAAVFLLMASYLLVLNTMTITAFREIIVLYMLPDTPIIVILLTVIGISVYAARQGIEVVARMAEWLLPIVLLVITFIAFFHTPDLEVIGLTPVLEEGWKPVLKGVIETFDFISYIVFVLLIIPYLNNSTTAGKALFAVAIGTTIALITESVYLMGVFGEAITMMYWFPAINFARYVDVADIITGIEAPLLTMWISAILLKISFTTFLFSDLVARFFKLSERKILTIPFGLVCSAWSVAMFPSIVDFLTFSSSVFALFSLTVGLFLPLFCLPFILMSEK